MHLGHYEEAISNIENNEPDLVLLDIRLYGQRSGIDVANYLNQRDKKLPFVFLTSQFEFHFPRITLTESTFLSRRARRP